MTEDFKTKLQEKGYTGDFTLSSLISFIPEGQLSLSRIPEAFQGWKAIAEDGEKRAIGKTPEEALTKLILDIK